VDRLSGTIAELTAAIEQEARQRSEVSWLMTHPSVGPITALACVLVIGSELEGVDNKAVETQKCY
jgi:transposase